MKTSSTKRTILEYNRQALIELMRNTPVVDILF